MIRRIKEIYWHDLFEAGVFLKAVNSVWETLGGIFLLTSLRNWVTHIFVAVSSSELIGDHEDFLFNYAHRHMGPLSDHTRVFVGVYLLFHGIMNAFLSYNLYRARLWAYPVSICFASFFFVYQVYRFAHTHSVILFIISVWDIVFIVLTWHEYKRQERKQHALRAQSN